MATPEIDPVTGLPKVIPGQTPWIGSQTTVDDSMANQVTALASKDSALNRMAATEGLKMANRRGLLNSSMAVSAAQDSVLKNVMPIAQQDALTAAGKNTAARAFEYGMTEATQKQGWDTSERLGTQEWQTKEGEAGRAWSTGERLGTQEWQSGENALQADLAKFLQAGQITSAEKMGYAEIASREGIAAAQNKLTWDMFNKDLDFKVSEGKLDRAFADKVREDTQAFDAGQQKLMNDLTLKIANLNLKGTQQAGLQSALNYANATYSENYRTIMSNPDLDAATRSQQLTNAKKWFEDTIGAAQTIYNTNIKWGS